VESSSPPHPPSSPPPTQEKKNKDYYLLKKYPKVVDSYQDLSLCEVDRRSQLKEKVEESRIKISKYKNSLKEMQELLKSRNIIRVIRIGEPHQQPCSTHLKSE
jgi:propanediol dehydratase small subunit